MVKYLLILLLLILSPQTTGLEINHSDVEHIEWNSDGTKLLIAYSNGEIVIMDAQTSETIYQTSVEQLRAVTWHPVDPYVFAYGEDLADGYTDAIKVYDLQTNQLIGTLEPMARMNRDFYASIYSISWSPTGSQIAVAVQMVHPSYLPSRINIWNVDFDRANSPMLQYDNLSYTESIYNQPQASAISPNIFDIDWSPDGMKLVGATGDGFVFIWDTLNPSEFLNPISMPPALSFDKIEWSPNGDHIAVSTFGNHEDDVVYIFNASSQQITSTLHTGHVWDIDWNSDGSQIATAEGHQIRLWDAETGTIVHTFPFDSDIYALAWRNNSIAVGSQSMTHFSVD